MMMMVRGGPEALKPCVEGMFNVEGVANFGVAVKTSIVTPKAKEGQGVAEVCKGKEGL